MTDLTPAQIAEREAARTASGEFGSHNRSAPEVTLDEFGGYPNGAAQQFASILHDRGDEKSVHASSWLREHGEDDDVAQVVGKLLDRFEDLAEEDGTIALQDVDDMDWSSELARELAGILEDRGSDAAANWVNDWQADDDFWHEVHLTAGHIADLAAYDR